MKHSIILILLLLTNNIIAQESSAKANEFTVAFYNTENLFDTQDDPNTYDEEFTPQGDKKWDSERYRKKLTDISKVLSSLHTGELPEIIGLAEVENQKVLEDLLQTDHFAEDYYGIVHQNSPDVRGIDVALLYRADAFDLLSSRFIPIRFPFDPESKVRDILYAKGISSSDTLHIFVNHWKSRSGGRKETENKRIYSAKILKSKTDSILKRDPDAKIIAMGDFNDEPVNKSLFNTLKAKNPQEIQEDTKLYNLMIPEDKNEKGTYHYKYEWYMLDNLIVSKALLKNEKGYTITHEQVQIFNPPWLMYDHPKAGIKIPNRTYGGDNYYGGISDHLAIYGTFRLN